MIYVTSARGVRRGGPSSSSSVLVLELRLDGRLVDDRPHRLDPAVPEAVEDVLGEGDAPAAHGEAQERAPGRAVEAQPAGHVGRLDHQKLDLEAKVGDALEVVLQQVAIA
jgi:hypothetical protein